MWGGGAIHSMDALIDRKTPYIFRKITRGKNRPLLHLIESNDDAVIRRVSREAFAALAKGKSGNEEACVRQAIEIMAGKSVRGVGPATASAVLAAYR